ncbi:DUF4055 domain-containing protein [Halomonas sp. 5021]|uniref:DUF4055 domain-containing protein n=1 Tax=Halomonas sp. 5021 TaxID=3082156 RepID=UPI002FC8E927
MPVDTLHPSYEAHEQKARRVRDAVAGSDAIKGRGFLYLPHPQEEYETLTGDAKKIADTRYKAYKERAVWVGVTRSTHDGLLGAVFRRDPEVTLPSPIGYMEEDADGSGMSLVQFARGNVSGLMTSGRHGVLVDYPEAEDGLTREQTQGMKATLRHYSSPSIVNWRRDGETLVLVVLREPWAKDVDEFEQDWDWQYRVLRLEDGKYTQQVYRDNQPAGEKVMPRQANGSPWQEIPFQFLGTVDNNETPDPPLLLDIADQNIAMYRNSATVEEAAHICGQPVLHIDIGETSTDEWTELNPNGISIGARRGVQTRGGGTMAMVQAEERNLPLKLMEQRREDMVALGAKLIERGASNETAESVRERSGSESANLSSVAGNVSDGIRNVLEWSLAFMGGSGEIEFELSRQFYDVTADPQDVMARIQELDRGLIAKSDYRTWRRKTGGIEPDRSDEDIDADVEAGGTAIGAL